MVGVSFIMLGALQARIDRAWDELADAYANDLEYLERTFGQYLRGHHPEVRSHHARQHLSFEDDAGNRLVLELQEPVRTKRGWGGARLYGWRGPKRVPLPGADLFLTFARGLHPEWVARWPGFPPRLAVVNDAFVAHAADAVFGPASPAGKADESRADRGTGSA